MVLFREIKGFEADRGETVPLTLGGFCFVPKRSARFIWLRFETIRLRDDRDCDVDRLLTNMLRCEKKFARPDEERGVMRPPERLCFTILALTERLLLKLAPDRVFCAEALSLTDRLLEALLLV